MLPHLCVHPCTSAEQKLDWGKSALTMARPSLKKNCAVLKLSFAHTLICPTLRGTFPLIFWGEKFGLSCPKIYQSSSHFELAYQSALSSKSCHEPETSMSGSNQIVPDTQKKSTRSTIFSIFGTCLCTFVFGVNAPGFCMHERTCAYVFKNARKIAVHLKKIVLPRIATVAKISQSKPTSELVFMC